MRRTFNNVRRRQKPRQIDYEEDLIVGGTVAPLAPVQKMQHSKNHRLVLKSQGYHHQAAPIDYSSPLNTSLDAKQGIFGGPLSPWK